MFLFRSFLFIPNDAGVVEIVGGFDWSENTIGTPALNSLLKFLSLFVSLGAERLAVSIEAIFEACSARR